MTIKYPKNLALGANVQAFPKTQYDKVVEIIDNLNTITDGSGLKSVGSNHTPAAVNATATATAAQVATGVITSTSASTVALTLPSAANLLAAIGGATKTWFDLAVDNSAGANIVTVTPSASITAATAVITGGATLTVAATATALFRIYFTSATAAKIYRIG